jgi:hypothetical protein
MVKVECIVTYNDLQLERLVKIGKEIEVTKDRADTLVEKGLVKVIEVIPDPVEEEKAPEPKKQVTKKQNKRK